MFVGVYLGGGSFCADVLFSSKSIVAVGVVYNVRGCSKILSLANVMWWGFFVCWFLRVCTCCDIVVFIKYWLDEFISFWYI